MSMSKNYTGHTHTKENVIYLKFKFQIQFSGVLDYHCPFLQCINDNVGKHHNI